jgi:hypothetical protein
MPLITLPWKVPYSQQREVVRFVGDPVISHEPIIYQKRKLENSDNAET